VVSPTATINGFPVGGNVLRSLCGNYRSRQEERATVPSVIILPALPVVKPQGIQGVSISA
jgi:hypothetical protein